MLEGKALSAGCMRYWTWSRIGRMPSTTRRSKSDCESPARAAFLHMTTGPSWQWSPTRTSWRQPRMTGIMHSGSVAWVLSSMSTERNCILARRGSPAPTQVQQITSAFCSRYKSTFTVACKEFRLQIMHVHY